jgi:sterol desaturase/sphingolipid hydroxylase (fatty acid hydroxylase superfamily)
MGAIAIWISSWSGYLLGAFSFGASTKEALKNFLHAHGLGFLWDLLGNEKSLYAKPTTLAFISASLLLWWGAGYARTRKWLVLPRSWTAVVSDFLYPFMTAPINATVIVVLAWPVHRLFQRVIPEFGGGLAAKQPLLVQGLMAFLITDLMFWVSHWLKHNVRWLWYFHSIHHSQVQLNLFTNDRNHPFESLVDLVIRTLPIALVGGATSTWFFVLFFGGIWGHFLHANIRTNLGPLKYVLATPQNHRVHHSKDPAYHNSNFGDHLTLWDWLFGTLCLDFDVYPETGVPGCEWIEETRATPIALSQCWFRQLIYPFREIGADVREFWNRPTSTGGRRGMSIPSGLPQSQEE